MGPYTTIIVGTDGSVTAGRAVRRAATMAHAMQVPIIVATAYMRQRPGDYGPLSEQVRLPDNIAAFGYMAAQETAHDGIVIARKAFPDLDIDAATPQGEPAEALLEFAESRPGHLMVIGNQGLGASGLFLLGNVPNKIIHHAVGDILIVRTGEDRPEGPPATMLVGTDGSKTASMAVDRALDVARAVGASLTILTVGRPDWARDVLAEASSRAEAAGVRHTTEFHEGDPAAVLVERGMEHELLIVGNRGMTGARRFMLGNVPNKVSHHVGNDLLIVKTT